MSTGKTVNPDEVLARYDDWHDVSSWPVSARQDALVKKQIKKQEDPLAKRGVIGAFNRSYSITEAIDRFIPDVYTPSAGMPGRYDYAPPCDGSGMRKADECI